MTEDCRQMILVCDGKGRNFHLFLCTLSPNTTSGQFYFLWNVYEGNTLSFLTDPPKLDPGAPLQ